MNEDKMDLQAWLGKSPDADFLREMIGFAAERMCIFEFVAMPGGAEDQRRNGWLCLSGAAKHPARTGPRKAP